MDIEKQLDNGLITSIINLEEIIPLEIFNNIKLIRSKRYEWIEQNILKQCYIIGADNSCDVQKETIQILRERVIETILSYIYNLYPTSFIFSKSNNELNKLLELNKKDDNYIFYINKEYESILKQYHIKNYIISNTALCKFGIFITNKKNNYNILRNCKNMKLPFLYYLKTLPIIYDFDFVNICSLDDYLVIDLGFQIQNNILS